MTNIYIDCVKEFNEAYGIETPRTFTVPDDKTLLLRMRLMTEELAELLGAIGQDDREQILDALCDLTYVTYGTVLAFGFLAEADLDLEPEPWEDWAARTITQKDTIIVPDVIYGFYDSLSKICDLKCEDNIMQGLSIIFLDLANTIVGYNFENIFGRAFLEVHRSNMSKLGKDGKPIKSPDGKVLKGENYSPPNLKQFL